MFSTARGIVRTTQDATVVGVVIVTHLAMINTRALAALPGDIWHRTCERNAKRCYHPRPTGADANQLSDPICCPEVEQLIAGLPTTASFAA